MTKPWSVFRSAEFSLRNPAAKQLFNSFVLAYSTNSSDGALLDRGDTVLHYRTATVPTTPGTPVFDQNWELVGLHRRHSTDLPRLDDGGGTYDGSEGVTVHALITRLAASIG